MKVYNSNIIGDKYFCIDIETTGLDENDVKAEILEVYSKIMIHDNKVKEYYSQYWGDNWADTEDIHQIKFEELSGKPRFLDSKEDIALFRALFLRCADPNDDLIFMAHYSPFEFKWLMKNLGFKRRQIKKIKKNLRVCDTRLIAKFLYPDEKHSLIPMCQKFNISFPEGQHDFHRADQDVNAMWELFLRLRENINPSELEDYNPKKYRFNFDQKHE